MLGWQSHTHDQPRHNHQKKFKKNYYVTHTGTLTRKKLHFHDHEQDVLKQHALNSDAIRLLRKSARVDWMEFYPNLVFAGPRNGDTNPNVPSR